MNTLYSVVVNNRSDQASEESSDHLYSVVVRFIVEYSVVTLYSVVARGQGP
jgi:hypothetical protein